MNPTKAINDYYEMTMSYNKKSTNFIHFYTVRSLIDCMNYLDITNLKKIDFETGYKIVRYFKENTGKNNDTINRALMYLKRVIRHNDIANPFLRFKNLPLDTQSFKRIYHEDLKTIVQYVQTMNLSKNSIIYRAMIFLLLDSGMRISELINIKINNIDFSSTPYKILLENTKNGKQRYAPFSDFSKPYILELAQLEPNRSYLFWNLLKDRQLNKNDVRQFYRRLSESLHIDRIHSHRFRKTFASLLIENGMPIEQLQNLFGHSRISTTMIYVQYKETKALTTYSAYNNWSVN